MAELDLLVLGDCNPDLIVTGDVEPAFGQVEQIVDGATLTIGGSGAIVACGAARLGLHAGLIAEVGDDLFGHFMLESLTERGVDVGGCHMTQTRPTGVSVMLARGHDRAILTAMGSIGSLIADGIDRDRLRASRHVHVSSYFLQSGLQRDLGAIFDESHEAGGTTSVDPNWDPSGRWDGDLLALLQDTDCFFPNETEACRIAGTTFIDAAVETLAKATSVVAVKRGAAGGLVRSGDQLIRESALTVEEVADTTGAGDSFDAGFIAGRVLGWPLDRCLALGCGCGSLSTRLPGGTAAQPTMEEATRALGFSP
ncbi:MAG TPA: carbohydrate kinase family protein [Actinomycetota bacterium]|jgi:sugar/nucleoside kinase (ribokinase family)|nr:carbohydrate kinase family protein [Actinomycetota bacterium]